MSVALRHCAAASDRKIRRVERETRRLCRLNVLWTAACMLRKRWAEPGDHVARLRNIPVHVVHGRYDRGCHLYQAEALVRALRDAGNNAVNYFITTAGHSSFEPETDVRLRTIMNELPPMTSPETASLQ
jgi:predicted esterase